MINFGAIIEAVRVGSSAAKPGAWATKTVATATVVGLLSACVPFIPPQYQSYVNPTFIDAFATVVITILGVVGVFGINDKIGLLPAKPESVSESNSNGQNNLSGGA